ncbi:tRNA (adenosine(37)-N6)-dimethylallyltransferase MiaA [Deinococcus sonorensis]|uniref:tRNA dimethylallyltransferase n=2 Tax=Deinococcus sonorensis TaxID=309891 RepID=A0AAU7UFV3_9DEIO
MAGVLVPILTAPTASGKTGLSLMLGRRVPLEVIAADAFTVYRGLDVGTAKPSAEERAAVPHHLIDVADVRETFDVARYVQLAEAAIQQVLERGRLPVVVGGTGFYLSALMQGLPLTPPSRPEQRAALEAELQTRGLDALLAEMEALNPAEARRMERNPRRVVRALEVYRESGRWPGEYGRSQPAHRYTVVAFAPPLPELDRRIEARTRAMLDGGLLEEAAWLSREVPPTLDPLPTVWQAIGYREALAVLDQTLTREAAAEHITVATRQYARRQLTWIRRQLKVEVQTPEQAAETLGAAVSGRLTP